MTYYGQWSPPADEVLYKNYFSNKKDGFFIECGAGDGISDSNTKFFESLGWSGICLEPSPVAFSQLCNNRKNSICLQLGLSDKDGDIGFTEAVNSANLAGGAVEYHPSLKAFVGACGYNFYPMTIRATRYDTLVSYLCIEHVDLLSLDVEGHEVAVIFGMSKTLPSVICVEYTCIGINRVKRLLYQRGYRFDFVSYNNAYFSIGMPEVEWFGVTSVMGCYEDD